MSAGSMHAVILNWQIGTNFGWGLLGLNVFAQWAHDHELQPIMGMEVKPDQLYGVDPLRHSRIWARAQASNPFFWPHKALSIQRGPSMRSRSIASAMILSPRSHGARAA